MEDGIAHDQQLPWQIFTNTPDSLCDDRGFQHRISSTGSVARRGVSAIGALARIHSQKKYTRQDSNLQPLVPKTSALSN